MPVATSEITEKTTLVDGRIRVKFKYTFEDGRFFNVGYVHAKDEQQVNELLATKANQLNESVKQSDAQEAISQNIQTPYKDAAQEVFLLEIITSSCYSFERLHKFPAHRNKEPPPIL